MCLFFSLLQKGWITWLRKQNGGSWIPPSNVAVQKWNWKLKDLVLLTWSFTLVGNKVPHKLSFVLYVKVHVSLFLSCRWLLHFTSKQSATGVWLFSRREQHKPYFDCWLWRLQCQTRGMFLNDLLCGYRVAEAKLAHILITTLNACSNFQNGSIVVFLSWRKTAIKLACAVLPSPDSTVPSTSPEPVQQFLEATSPPKQWPLRRTKRFFKNPYPHSPYKGYYYQPYMPYVPCFVMQPLTTTTAPPTTTSPLLNPDVWRRVLNLNTVRDQNTIPQNTIDRYVRPRPGDWHQLRNRAQQAIFQNYLHKALGFQPQIHPLNNAISNIPLLKPKPCRRSWFDGSCLDSDNSVGQILNLPLSSLSFKNKDLGDQKPVYSRVNRKSNVIWDQLPWFKN